MHGQQAIFGMPSVDVGAKLYFLPAPVRLLDTRSSGASAACYLPASQITSATEFSYNVRTVCTGIPAEAKGIIGNVTVLNHPANGFLTLWPSSASRPTTSNVNYNTALSVMNVFFCCGLSPQSTFSAFSSQTIDIIVDIVGYFA